MHCLLSAVGTSDPVRNCQDGSMLHIVRHYRPDKVVLFISAEMRRLDAGDNRYALAFEHLRGTLNGYCPEVRRVYLEENCDPSDFDAFDRQFRGELNRICAEYTNAGEDVEFLLNLSSGTTQMKSTWEYIAIEAHWKVRAIQVKAPAPRANTAENTANRNYNVAEMLDVNIDDEPDAPNRCSEPSFVALRRAVSSYQIHTLIDQWDYDAARALFGHMPEERPVDMQIVGLLKYASARQHLKHDFSELLPRELNYLRAQLESNWDAELKPLIEYQLLLRNLQSSKNISEYIFRLNPFVVELERLFLARKLDMPANKYAAYQNGRWFMDRNRLNANAPDILSALERKLGRALDGAADISQYVLSNMISLCMDELGMNDEDANRARQYFERCLDVNRMRNSVAHKLYAISDDEVRAETGFDSNYYVRAAQRVLSSLLDGSARQRFDSFSPYAQINDIIKNLLAQ